MFFLESGDEYWHEEACCYFNPVSPGLISDLPIRHLKFSPSFYFFLLTENKKKERKKKNLSTSGTVVQPWNAFCSCVQVWSRMPATCASTPAAAEATWRPTWTGTTLRDVTSAICVAKSLNQKSHWKATDWATRTKVRVSGWQDSFFLLSFESPSACRC